MIAKNNFRNMEEIFDIGDDVVVGYNGQSCYGNVVDISVDTVTVIFNAVDNFDNVPITATKEFYKWQVKKSN